MEYEYESSYNLDPIAHAKAIRGQILAAMSISAFRTLILTCLIAFEISALAYLLQVFLGHNIPTLGLPDDLVPSLGLILIFSVYQSVGELVDQLRTKRMLLAHHGQLSEALGEFERSYLETERA